MKDSERIAKGQILVHAFVEILGAPKEYVEETMLKVVDDMETQTYLELIADEVAEAKEQDKLFSAYADVQVWVKSFTYLIEFIFNYMPSSIEIIEPAKIELKREDLGTLLTEVAGRLHGVDASVKDLRAKNKVIGHNTKAIIRNFIISAVREKDRTVEELELITGLPNETLLAYLKSIEEEGKIKKIKDTKIKDKKSKDKKSKDKPSKGKYTKC